MVPGAIPEVTMVLGMTLNYHEISDKVHVTAHDKAASPTCTWSSTEVLSLSVSEPLGSEDYGVGSHPANFGLIASMTITL